MISNYRNSHEKFKLDGIHYSNENLTTFAHNLVREGEAFQKEIGHFLMEWLNDDDVIELSTSGSTGTPKSIKIKKQAMVNSAIATGTFFNLKPGNTALHGLPTQFIAGKMMLVRALVLGLELDCIEPKTNLVFNSSKPYHFSAMIPLQLENCLQRCNNINTIIVGGASVSNALKQKLQNIKSSVFETYGMTETVTHIAVKKLNNFDNTSEKGLDNFFKLLPHISISQDERDCLVIEAPQLSEEKIITNDVVNIVSETAFEWLGRFDNIINSGGLKLVPEHIEAKLQNKIKERFFIASQPHAVLGNQLILVVEGTSKTLEASVFSELKKHEKPKHIYFVNTFMETASGKVQRAETLKLISSLNL